MTTINSGDSQILSGSQQLEAPINVAGELNVSGELNIDTKPGISGIVTDSSNNPIENATVNLFLQDGGTASKETTTDANGAYSFSEHPDATNSIQTWHVVASYDDGTDKFFSRSKFGVRASLQTQIPPGPQLVFSDSFEDGDYTDKWDVKYNQFGGPGNISVTNSFATDGSFSVRGNTDGATSAGLHSQQTFSGNSFVLKWDQRFDGYPDANAWRIGLTTTNTNVNDTDGDPPQIRWATSEREGFSDIFIHDGTTEISQSVGFIPQLNQTYSMELRYENDTLELIKDGVSQGTLTQALSFTDLVIYFVFGEVDGFIDNIRLLQ